MPHSTKYRCVANCQNGERCPRGVKRAGGLCPQHADEKRAVYWVSLNLKPYSLKPNGSYKRYALPGTFSREDHAENYLHDMWPSLVAPRTDGRRFVSACVERTLLRVQR